MMVQASYSIIMHVWKKSQAEHDAIAFSTTSHKYHLLILHICTPIHVNYYKNQLFI